MAGQQPHLDPHHLNKDEARAGATPGVMRYVLGISMALVVILFAILLIQYV